MSTLETAISFSLILVLLSYMIAGPESIALDSFDCASDGSVEISCMLEDADVCSQTHVNGAVCYDTSPEKFCTFLTGISDNYRLIYGSFYDLSKEAADEEGEG